MKIKWLGHSCFLITSVEGVRIVLDPYKSESHLNYIEVREKADLVTVSHEHYDHNYTALIPGNPEVVKGHGTRNIKGIAIRGIDAWHDEAGGKERGSNTIFCLSIEGMQVCHMGDLGHLPTEEQLIEIGKVDILLLPVGGVFTIDVKAANELIDKLKPKVAIPMHYKTDRCTWLQYEADDFTRGKSNVKRLDTSEVELSKAKLPWTAEIIILQYSR